MISTGKGGGIGSEECSKPYLDSNNVLRLSNVPYALPRSDVQLVSSYHKVAWLDSCSPVVARCL